MPPALLRIAASTLFGFLLVVAQQEVITARAQRPTQKKSPAATGELKPQPSSTVMSSPVGQAAPQPPSNKDETTPTQREQNPSDDKPKVTDWIQAGVNVVLLIVIIVQSCIYNKQRKLMQLQWRAMRLALVETRKSTRQNEKAIAASEKQAIAAQASVKAAELSAEAAMQSVQVAREAFYVGQRAYIGIKKMEIAQYSGHNYPTLTITWINGGNTPAWRFRSIPQLVLGEKPTPKINFSNLEDDFSDISVSFIPAGEEKKVIYQITEFSMTSEVWAAMKGGNKRLYALAEGSYLDVTGKERPFLIWALYDPYIQGFVELEEEQKDYYPSPT